MLPIAAVAFDMTFGTVFLIVCRIAAADNYKRNICEYRRLISSR